MLDYLLFLHPRTADSVLTSVQTALQQSGLNQVTTVGHSLGTYATHSFRWIFLNPPSRRSPCTSGQRLLVIVFTRRQGQYD